MSKAQYNAGTFLAQDGQVYELQMTSDGFLKVTGAGGGTTTVGGPAADDAAASGNPVPVGARYEATPDAVDTGDIGYLAMSIRRALHVQLWDSANNAAAAFAADNADGIATSGTANRLKVVNVNTVSNGATGDVQRSVTNGTNSTGTGIVAAGLLAQLDDTSPTTVTENQFGNLRMAGNRALLVRPHGTSAEAWNYAAATGGIANSTTAVTVKAAVASMRNYVTSMQLSSDALGAATEFAIRDGAGGTVLWRMKIGTAGIVNGLHIDFPVPLQSTANTLLEVVTLTASITGGVFANLQGYTAP